MSEHGLSSSSMSPGLSEKCQPVWNRGMTLEQLDFELKFYEGVAKRNPDYVEVLRVLAHGYSLRGHYAKGLRMDRRICELCPDDPIAHYNLACGYSLLQLVDLAIESLRMAFELGYRDFEHLQMDRDLDAIRHDRRFTRLVAQYRRRALACR